MEPLRQLVGPLAFVILMALAAVMFVLHKLYLHFAEKAKAPEEAKLHRELAKLAAALGVVCVAAGGCVLYLILC